MKNVNDFLKSRAALRLRRSVQFVFLVLFSIFLIFSAVSHKSLLIVKAILNADLLIALSNLISSRAFSFALVYAVAFLMLALLAGRFWCGWLCPLGTVLDVFPRFRLKQRAPEWFGHIKTALWICIILLSAAGVQALLFLDPVTIFVRTFAVVVWPLAFHIYRTVEWLAHRIAFLEAPWMSFSYRLKLPDVFSFQPHFSGFWFFALLFAAIYALNIFGSRFWCKNLCPLGGLLAFFSKFSIFRLRAKEKCSGCLRCSNICPVEAITCVDGRMKVDFGECIFCLKCVQECRRGEMEFSATRITAETGRELLSEKRAFLGALGASLLSFAFFSFEKKGVRADLIRPPGATEESLSLKCVRCGACIRVCPTGAVQPSLLEAGAEMLFTPVIVPRTGYCDYNCNRCGKVCPYGAIPELQLEEKQRTSIGKAVINKKKCLPWSEGKPCIVCEEACPVPNKAIELEEKSFLNEAGELVRVQVPVVHICRCIGCGICENKCPVEGTSAIRVFREEFVEHSCSGRRRRGR